MKTKQLAHRHAYENLMRRLMLWTTLGFVASLAILSFIGALMGSQRASVLFNSPLMADYWYAFALFFVGGLLAFKRLVTSFGLLSMHAGTLLILLGAMLGSDGGHAVAHKWLGSRKIPSGYLAIFEGDSSNIVLASDMKTELGKLPFSLKLKDFWIEYYEPDQKRWDFIIDAPPADGDAHGGPRRQDYLDLEVGREVELPFVGARLEVLQYIESAAPTFPHGAPRELVITAADGAVTRVPAEVGSETALDSGLKVRITATFTHLMVQGSGGTHEVVNVDGSEKNPALKVEVEKADGTTKAHYVMAKHQMHGGMAEGVKLEYELPQPTGAAADPSTGLPAAEVVVRYGQRESRSWLIAVEGDSYVELSLAELLASDDEDHDSSPKAEDPPASEEAEDEGDVSDEHAGHDHAKHEPVPARLVLAKPTAPIKDYKSDVVVLDEGEEMGGKVVEVNHPLHYGGYHFYQHSYDDKQGRYTVLSVTSDSGLGTVYAGFALLTLGVFWWCWIQPVTDGIRRRKANGA